MSQTAHKKDFSKLRTFLWPVRRHELKKLLPLLFVSFLLSFDYNVLRCMKDTLVVTAKDSGAEVIPFIKVWVMFPMTIVLTWIFIRLSNRMDREKVFYCMLGIFLAFFSAFAFYLYPKHQDVHPHALAQYLTQILPAGMKGFIAMIHYWSFALFYAMAELWSNIVLSLLFWGFANQVTKLDEAKRFYGLFGVGINFSGIASGQLSIFVTNFATRSHDAAQGDTWGYSMNWLISMVVIAGILAIISFAWFNHNARKNPELVIDAQPKEKKVKQKFSMRENIRFLLSSKYMLYIVLIVVSYNVVINLVEVLWKHEVRELYPDPTSYNIYMNEVTSLIGVLATLISFFISGNSIRLFGWTKTALITPVILLITSVGFFGFFFMKGSSQILTLLGGFSPLTLVVFFGSMQNCLSRASKYTVFDATKEMAFIPLSREDKIKGKSAVDGICNRLGKSGGSVIYQALLIVFSTISASAPYVAIILFAIIGIWIFAVKNLGSQFNELVHAPAEPKHSPAVTVATAI